MKRIIQANVFFLILLFLLACNNNRARQTFLASSPEAQGVSTESILAFLDAAEASSVEVHSFMYLRHGKVIAQGWWYPYQSDLRHTMYSVSKSFVSTAIGLAVDEGLITVDDKVISFFSEELPDTISPNLAELKIKDLLTMRAGNSRDYQRDITYEKTDWIKEYLAVSFDYEPGTRFAYNSMASYTLSAIVQKVTGKKTIDYLTERLFIPMHIVGADWEIDPKGINTGGWGLRLKTEDLAKVGQLYLQKGVWDGNQLISSDWVEEATRKSVDMGERGGYGYQFWQTAQNGYMAFGAMGQHFIVLPDQDAVLVFTAEDANDRQEIVKLAFEHLLPGIKADKLPENGLQMDILKDRLDNLALPLPAKAVTMPLDSCLNGKTYSMAENENSIESVTFYFANQVCKLKIIEAGKSYPLSFGNGEWVFGETSKPGPNLTDKAINHFATLSSEKVAGSYTWKNPNTIELTLRYIESPHHELYTFGFDGETITLQKRISYRNEQDLPILAGILQPD